MLNNTFVAVMVASLAACGVTSVGVWVISRYERWAREHSVYFMCFAAGVLISVSFLHIVPQAFSMNPLSPAFLLLGYLALHLFNRFLTLYVCHDIEYSGRATAITPTLGIGFHSFIDGVIYSVAFKVSLFTGALASIGMILHEFPEGIVTFVLLERGGIGRRRAAVYALLAAAVTTPLGALVSYPLMSAISQPVLGSLLAASAGALIYVGATHLLPAVEKEPARFSMAALGAGVVTALIIVASKG